MELSAEQYRTLFESIDEGFCVIEVLFDAATQPVDYRFLQVNPAFERQTGLINATGRRMREMAPEHEPHWFETYGRIALTGRPERFQDRAEALGRWYDVYAFSIGEPQDRRVAILFRDVSQTKRAETVLRESEERQRFLLELSDALRPLEEPEEIRSTAMQIMGAHLGVNRAVYVDASGQYDRMDVVPGYVHEVEPWHGPFSLAEFGATLGTAFAQGETVVINDVQQDPRFSDSLGTYTALEIRSAIGTPLIKNGSLVAVMGVHQSTPRKWAADEIALIEEVGERTWAAVERATAEAHRRESDERYRRLFTSMAEGFALCEMIVDEQDRGVDYRILEVNPASEELVGLSAEAATGRTIRELLPQLDEGWIETCARAGIGREQVRLERYFEPFGRWLEVTLSPVGDPTRHQFTSLYADVTSRRKADETLREDDRRKDEFLAMLAHELRNPLGSMHSALALAEARNRHGESSSRAMEILARQTARLARLVDDLVDVSRISRGTIELRKESVDLAGLMERSLEAVRSESHGEYEIRVSLPAEQVTLHADALRLEQVVTNIVGNAVKYTDPGGCIDIAAAAHDGSVEIRVRDTGIGIEAPFMEHVFDLFKQSDKSLDRARGGLGIGLTVAKRLVELHGGTIEAHSEGRGKGSEFVVRLPLDPGPADGDGALREPSRTREGTNRQVLIVDDNGDHAEVLAALVTELGHRSRTAPDGPTAMRLVHELRPDIVLLDIGLPGMTGYEVAAKLKELAPSKPMKIVALTGYGQAGDRRRSAEAGFDEHMVKPISVKDLERLLDT